MKVVKYMKKILSVFLTLIIIISVTACGGNTDTSSPNSNSDNFSTNKSNLVEYKIKDTGISISIPSDYTVFTKETAETTDNSKIDKDVYIKILKDLDENASLIAVSPDNKNEIQINCTISGEFQVFNSFKVFSDSEIQKLGKNIEEEYNKIGIELENLSVTEQNGQKYIHFFGKNTGTEYGYKEFLQYSTYIDDVSFNLVTRPLGENTLTDNDKTIFDNVYKSIKIEYKQTNQE